MIAGRHFRAPAADRALLADPPPAEVGPLLAENRRRLSSGRVFVAGEPLPAFRDRARSEVVALARDYLRDAGEPVPSATPGPLLLSGHQPELFHPGVWVKNFALCGLARRHGLTPLNLVVDNDTAKSAALRLPVWQGDGPGRDPATVRRVAVSFDRFAGDVPFEERGVLDLALWMSFADRARPLWRNWGFEPLLPEFWAEVLRDPPLPGESAPLVGERFAAARRALERRWGCENLEVPLSRVCGGEAFARFAFHLLADLPRFQAAYNRAVGAYREAHGIRSPRHPVPDLERQGEWLEAPLWAWRAGARRRGRLFARRDGADFRFRLGDGEEVSLPARSAEAFAAAWRELAGRGVKVRSRALTTTLFARLGVGDAFIHGIGGGKYDEVTDAILADFFGAEPPAFLVLSATLHLPVPAFPATPEDVEALKRLERDVFWNPQRHLPPDAPARPEVAATVASRRALLADDPPDRPRRRERFWRLRRATEALRPYVADELGEVRERLARAEQEARANAILRRRDYAFVLFPEEVLRPFLTRVMGG